MRLQISRCVLWPRKCCIGVWCMWAWEGCSVCGFWIKCLLLSTIDDVVKFNSVLMIFLNIGSVHFWQRTVTVSSWIKLPLQAYQLFPCMAGPLLLITYIQYLHCVSFQRVWRHTFSQAVTSTAVKTCLFVCF